MKKKTSRTLFALIAGISFVFYGAPHVFAVGVGGDCLLVGLKQYGMTGEPGTCKPGGSSCGEGQFECDSGLTCCSKPQAPSNQNATSPSQTVAPSQEQIDRENCVNQQRGTWSSRLTFFGNLEYYCDTSTAGSSGSNAGSSIGAVTTTSAATNTGAAANVTLTKAQCTGVTGRVCKTTPASGDVCQSAATDCGQCCMPSSAGSTTTPSSTTASSGTTTAATTGTGSSNSSDTSGASTATGIVIPTKAQTGLSEASLADVITSLAASLLEIFGIIAVIAFIVTGFQYLLANGDEKEMQGAKRNLTYSIISVIVALSGVIIVGAINSLLNASPNGFF